MEFQRFLFAVLPYHLQRFNLQLLEKGSTEEKRTYAESLFQLSKNRTSIRKIILPVMVPEFNVGGGHWFSLPTVVLSASSGDDVMVYPFNFDSGSRKQSIGAKDRLNTICSPL